MDTYLDLVNELMRRLQVQTNSTLYDTARCQQLIKDAHMWATGLFPFRELTDPQTTTTDGTNRYDYPEDYRSNSIFIIYIAGKPYRKKRLENFLEFIRLNPTSTKRIFCDVNRQYMMFPTPAALLTLDVYGQIQATQFVEDGDRSIFSLSNVDGNEAIVLKALSVAKDDKSHEQDAVALLTKLYADQKDNSQFEQVLDAPYFDVPDFFAGGAVSVINTSWQGADLDQ